MYNVYLFKRNSNERNLDRSSLKLFKIIYLNKCAKI